MRKAYCTLLYSLLHRAAIHAGQNTSSEYKRIETCETVPKRLPEFVRGQNTSSEYKRIGQCNLIGTKAPTSPCWRRGRFACCLFSHISNSHSRPAAGSIPGLGPTQTRLNGLLAPDTKRSFPSHAGVFQIHRGWRDLRGGASRAGVVLPAGYPYSEKRMRAASRRPFPPGPLELTRLPLSHGVTRTRFLDCYCRTWDKSLLSTRSKSGCWSPGAHELRVRTLPRNTRGLRQFIQLLPWKPTSGRNTSSDHKRIEARDLIGTKAPASPHRRGGRFACCPFSICPFPRSGGIFSVSPRQRDAV